MQDLTPEVAFFLAFEINDHLSETNQYFQKTNFVLDDLHVYGEPFSAAHQAIIDAAEGRITRQEAMAVVSKAIDDTMELHAAMDAENVAA